MENPIFPCLWFNGQAKAAAEFYCSVFKNSRIIADTPMVVTFELNGRKFMGLNGGPHFTFNEADKFGVSWQIIPTVLGDLMNDPQRAPRVVEAFMKMKKFDIETLLKA